MLFAFNSKLQFTIYLHWARSASPLGTLWLLLGCTVNRDCGFKSSQWFLQQTVKWNKQAAVFPESISASPQNTMWWNHNGVIKQQRLSNTIKGKSKQQSSSAEQQIQQTQSPLTLAKCLYNSMQKYIFKAECIISSFELIIDFYSLFLTSNKN